MLGKNETFLTQAELAERWKCSEGTIHNRRKAGIVPFIRLPGARNLMIPLSSVEAIERKYLVEEVVLEPRRKPVTSSKRRMM